MTQTLVTAVEAGWPTGFMEILVGFTLAAGLVGQLAVTALWLRP